MKSGDSIDLARRILLCQFYNKTCNSFWKIFSKNKVDLDSKRPERSLTKGVHRKKGRNSYGRITSRRRGGGHKKLYREIDFRRSKLDMEAKVIALEYDPNRTAHLALLEYSDGVKSYILAPASVEVGDTLLSSNDKIDFKPGNALPLKLIPLGTKVHCVEMLQYWSKISYPQVVAFVCIVTEIMHPQNAKRKFDW